MYYKLGKIPNKRHTVFKAESGAFYYEELFGTEGFTGVSSLLYHVNRPTRVKEIIDKEDVTPEIAFKNQIQSRKLKGFKIKPKKDYLESRTVMLLNQDIKISLAAPMDSMKEYFYKNALEDELIFIHQGTGNLKTFLGDISFVEGDYIVIPRGIIYQFEFNSTKNKMLIIESSSPITAPNRYKNKEGQFLETSPYCERDLKMPQNLKTIDEEGDFKIKIKKGNLIHTLIYSSHPFSVVGWDGYNYPYAFSIHDFEPITGRIHQPPPVHQTFVGHNFVVCSFVPRLYDYHPKSVPAPYNHSNIDSDEVLYYVAGNFMSRKGIKEGDITHHPAGIPHGPHPGTMENSIGKKETKELAVMIDPFKPLWITKAALEIEAADYYKSWI